MWLLSAGIDKDFDASRILLVCTESKPMDL